MLQLPPVFLMTGHLPPPELKEDAQNIENRFSPGPADQRNQATLRHPERSTYRCFLTDLAGFTDICRVGPNYANRQDRKKTGLFHWNKYHHGGTRSLYSSCRALSSEILTDQQAIFLLCLRRYPAVIGHNGGGECA